MVRQTILFASLFICLTCALALLEPEVKDVSESSASGVEYVIVLMMENRSFDHLLGWLKEMIPSLAGLTGTETNCYDTSDPNSPCVVVSKNGYDIGPDDPTHTFDGTAEEIYGFNLTSGSSVPSNPNMTGFVQNAVELGHNASNPMAMFTPENNSAPVINFLAKEFAVMDNWFCSLPGPTDPNRAFFMSGTSDGYIDNFNGTLYTQQSYFDFLTQHDVSWNAYYQDDPWAIMYFEDVQKPENVQKVQPLDSFYEALESETLSQFSLLQPRMLVHSAGLPTWQHPDASIREGERLIKDIYEAIRNSVYWEKTAFILTYDEHGGFYDHVPPPQTGIPSPDGKVAYNGFAFDRLGIRIPTLVISPLIPKGTVEHDAPASSKPTNTSQYESTSIMSTANKIFGISPNDHLSARAAWSSTFEHLFSLDTPRTDCPTTLPFDLPSHRTTDLRRDVQVQKDIQLQSEKPLNDHLQIQVDFYCKFNGHNLDTCGKDIVTQGQASAWVLEQASIYMNSLQKR